jgi:LysR family transcriptional regulator, transcription activator of glutamate synthase operon
MTPRGCQAAARTERAETLELRQIQYFVVVAGQRNFSRAAEAVGVAQPAISQQIRRLEEELGVDLLDRSSRPVTLTEAGEAFLTRAERMVAEAKLAKDDMREFAGVGRGRLVIGALPSLARVSLAPVLARFHAAHPRIELIVREENTEKLERLVGLGELDLAVLHAVPGQYTGQASHRGIMIERLFEEELVAIVPPNHRFAERTSLDVRALRDEGFVLRARGSGLARAIATATTAAGFTPLVAAECTSLETLRSLVSAGIGISIVSRSAAEGAGPTVVVLPLRPSLPSHTTAVAWRSDSRPSAAVEAMLALIRKQLVVVPPPSTRRGRNTQ